MLMYDLRSQLRRPGWALVLALAAYCFYTGLLKGMLTPEITMSIDLPLLGLDRALVSIGEWGRAILLSLELFLSIPLSALVGFVAAPLFSDETEHGEVLWATPRSTLIPAHKVVAGTTLAWSCVVVGGAAAFLNPEIRANLSPAGWQWLPLWLALAWLRIAVWTTACGFVFYLTKSKWAAIGVLPVVQMLWFGLAGYGATGLYATVHRSLLAWGFISPYAPLGIGVARFLMQVGALVGMVVLLFGVAIFARWIRFRASSQRARPAVLATVAGAGILGVCLALLVISTARAIAPAAPASRPDCPTESAIWSQDGHLIRAPGVYSCLILPSPCDTPTWFAEYGVTGWVRRFDEPLSVPAKGMPRAERAPVVESLVLAASIPSSIPDEFGGYGNLYRKQIEPMASFASWVPASLSIVLVYPSEVLDFNGFVRLEGNELWIGEMTLTGSASRTLWDTARAFATAAGLGDEDSVYLTLVLVDLTNPALVEAAIGALTSVRAGETRFRWPYLPSGVREISRRDGATARILAAWNQGEVMGHTYRVEQLLQGRDHDSD